MILKVYDIFLGYLLHFANVSTIAIRQHRGFFHCKVRLKERYNLNYTKGIEKGFISQIKGKNGQKYLYKQNHGGKKVYRLKFQEKHIFALYTNYKKDNRIVTFLTKEML